LKKIKNRHRDTWKCDPTSGSRGRGRTRCAPLLTGTNLWIFMSKTLIFLIFSSLAINFNHNFNGPHVLIKPPPMPCWYLNIKFKRAQYTHVNWYLQKNNKETLKKIQMKNTVGFLRPGTAVWQFLWNYPGMNFVETCLMGSVFR